jgi:osmotically-inducible protein OsmY
MLFRWMTWGTDMEHNTDMPRMLLLATACSVLLASGCAAVVVGGAAAGASAAHDRRSMGTVLDDTAIEVAAIDRIYQERDAFRGTRIKAVSHNGWLLLVGEVGSEALRDRAEERAGQLAGVRRVINELQITTQPGPLRRTGDTALNGRTKAALFAIDLPGFDPSRVNVTTIRGEVYLMGLVTPAEADAVVEVVRGLRGVRRVVKVFEYLD